MAVSAPPAPHDGTNWREETRRAWLMIVICGLLLTSALLWRRVTGHSYPLNLNWHEGFVAELRAGVLYPRWLNDTNQQLGAPSFYFYAPLPFFVSGALDLISPIRLSTPAYVYASAVISVVCSGLTTFAFTRRVVSSRTAILAAIVYMAMPYHLGIDIWWRAAVGELWAFVWPPLILAGAARQWRGERWGREVVAASWAGLIVSHLPSLLIVICGATCTAIAWYLTSRNRGESRRVIVASAAGLGVALALTSPYWIPAVTTLGYTDVTRFMTSGWFLYSNNFVLPCKPGSWNGTIEMLLLLELLAACALVWLGIRTRRLASPAFRISVACAVAAVLMMTPISVAVWRLIPPLQRVQFPWRFHLLFDLSLVLMLALVLDQSLTRGAWRILRFVAPVLCFGAGVLWSVVFTPQYSDVDAQDLRSMRAVRADANEYRTRWTPLVFYLGIRNGDTLLSRQIRPHAVSANARGTVRLEHASAQPTDVVLNRFWYPSLRVSAADDGRGLDTHPEESTGLAVVRVPAGVNAFHTSTAMLAEEKRAWATAVVTCLVLLAVRLGRRNAAARA